MFSCFESKTQTSTKTTIKNLTQYFEFAQEAPNFDIGDYVQLKIHLYVPHKYGECTIKSGSENTYAYVLALEKGILQVERLGDGTDLVIATIKNAKIITFLCDSRMFHKAHENAEIPPFLSNFVRDTPITDPIPGSLVRPRTNFELQGHSRSGRLTMSYPLRVPLIVLRRKGDLAIVAGESDTGTIEEIKGPIYLLCPFIE